VCVGCVCVCVGLWVWVWVCLGVAVGVCVGEDVGCGMITLGEEAVPCTSQCCRTSPI
jgi:hypothetical protein